MRVKFGSPFVTIFALVIAIIIASPMNVQAQSIGLNHKVIKIQSISNHTIRDPATGNITTVRVATGGTLTTWHEGVGWSQMYRVRLDAPNYNRFIFVDWQMQGRSVLGISHYDWTDAISTFFKIRFSQDYQTCQAEAWLGRKTGLQNVITYEITGWRTELLSTRFSPAYCSIEQIS
jgi:hypothetical protein